MAKTKIFYKVATVGNTSGTATHAYAYVWVAATHSYKQIGLTNYYHTASQMLRARFAARAIIRRHIHALGFTMRSADIIDGQPGSAR